jgi:hypothetical protein
MQNLFDPVDGPLGSIAWIAGGLFHWLIVLWLNLIRSPNLDMVAYNMLRIFSGWLLIIGLITLPLWWFIGWWTLVAIFGLILLVSFMTLMY